MYHVWVLLIKSVHTCILAVYFFLTSVFADSAFKIKTVYQKLSKQTFPHWNGLFQFWLPQYLTLAQTYMPLSQCLPSRVSKHMTCCKAGHGYGAIKLASYSRQQWVLTSGSASGNVPWNWVSFRKWKLGWKKIYVRDN